MGITKNGSSLRFGGNTKSNMSWCLGRPAHLQCGWNSNFYQGHISGKLLLNWRFSAWKIHQHWKKISLWAYPECLIVQTIQNTIRNYYLYAAEFLFFYIFWHFVDTFFVSNSFVVVLLISAAHYCQNIKVLFKNY